MKTPTWPELIKDYGNAENVIENVDYHILKYIINDDPNLNASQKSDLKDAALKKWIHR